MSSSTLSFLTALTLTFLFMLNCLASSPSPSPRRLMPHTVRIDHRLVETHSDLVLDTHRPAFDWQLDEEVDLITLTPLRNITQIAYRLIVKRGDVVHWDSSKVLSSQSNHVVYSGSSFTSDTSYSYALMYWSATGATSEWACGQFRTGLFDLVDWQGEWIGSDALNMNQMRRVFTLPSDAARATIFYSGVGYSELWLDGKKVDPSRVLDPGWTQYYRRCLYVSFDLTSLLNAGHHALGVILGDGWYSRQPQLISDGNTPLIPANITYGPPRLILQLNVQLNDGTNFTLVSDQQWLGRSGPTVAAGVYQGSVRDMRLERIGWSTVDFVDPITKWLPADILPSPVGWGGLLSLQFMDPIRAGPDALHVRTKAGPNAGHYGASIGLPITQTVLRPVSENEWAFGNIFDLGQNMVGWCTVNVTHLRGASIYVRYSEFKRQPLTGPLVSTTSVDIDTANLKNIAVEDIYITNGTAGGELLEPQFTYRGFRYVKVLSNYLTYPASAISCPVVHSEGSLVGNFTSSNPVINQIQQNILWTQSGNTMSLMTDCPQRNERKGWLGDASGSADLSMYNFDFANVYRNHLNLIGDEQFPNGGVSVTIPIACCPTPGDAPSGDPNWTTAFAWITWMLYDHYGDTSTMATHYDAIQALFMEVYTNWYPQHGLREMIVQFGDWYVQPDGGTDNALVTSFAFLRDCYTLMQMSMVLNKTDRGLFYNKTYASLAKEFHSLWYNNVTGSYSNGAQTANALALALPHVVPVSLQASVAEQLVKDINSKGHMTCGIIGAAQLLPVLSSYGHHDVAVGLATSIAYPSWGWTFNNQYENATTVWERFAASHDGEDASHNHHMFSPIGSWFYRFLAGIKLNGLKEMEVWPRLQHDHSLLRWVKAEVETPKGRVEVEWESEWDTKTLIMHVTLPSNTQARVRVEPPVKGGRWEQMRLDGELLVGNAHHHARTPLSQRQDVRWTVEEGSGVVDVRVGSGSYAFVGQWH